MRRLIATSVLVACILCAETKAGPLVCLAPTEVTINTIHPRIHLREENLRKGEIVVLLRIHCDSGEPIVPGSFDEALRWLDLALPLDFKTGLTKGEYFNPYLSTLYGASVEEDIFEFFTKAWKLGIASPACRGRMGEGRSREEDAGCFTLLLDELRNGYLDRAAKDAP